MRRASGRRRSDRPGDASWAIENGRRNRPDPGSQRSGGLEYAPVCEQVMPELACGHTGWPWTGQVIWVWSVPSALITNSWRAAHRLRQDPVKHDLPAVG
jgi:hypothetical protein